MGLSISQLELLRNMVHERTGIYYPVRKNFFLEARIQTMMRKTGYGSESALLQDLLTGQGALWGFFIKAFTTNHTFFFREADHFTAMTDDISRRGIRSPRIWVAASSTGEEVYSIAISLRSRGIMDYRIMASDINRANLLALRKGEYPASRLEHLPAGVMEKWFLKKGMGTEGDWYGVKPVLKEGVYTRVINLSTSLRFTEDFDYIFCRNVLMYFQEETQMRVLEMLAGNLAEEGMLFIGHSESPLRCIRGMESVGVAAFRKKVVYGKDPDIGN